MKGRRKRGLRVAVRSMGVAGAVLLGVLSASAVSAVEAPPPATATWKPARPYWIELPQTQRDALAPLAEDWERLDLQTKKKWLEIANRYPRMSVDEQGRTQQRMREWARLTPDQRRVARDSFARVRAMPPEERAVLLRKYQELPDEKKQALTTEGKASKVIVVPKSMPTQQLAPRRAQIREGASDRNPAVAAQKSASPVVAPARPAPKPPAETVVPSSTAVDSAVAPKPPTAP